MSGACGDRAMPKALSLPASQGIPYMPSPPSTWSSDWQNAQAPKESLPGRGMEENVPENTPKKEEPAAHESRQQPQCNRNVASGPQQRKSQQVVSSSPEK